jgi:glycosyltransferase involved in cell wall biosynthesis
MALAGPRATVGASDPVLVASQGHDGRPVRVLAIVENASVPNDARVWSECRTLESAGFDVEVISPQGTRSDTALFENRDGIRIHRYRRMKAGNAFSSYLKEYASSLIQMRRIIGKLAAERPFDVVHVANPPDILFLAALSLKRRGARFIFDHHDLVPELFATRFGAERKTMKVATRAAERLSFRLADVVISTNQSYRQIALTRGKKQPEDVFVVRNGPDLSRFRPVEPDPSLKGGRAHLLVYVGVINPQDGVDHALRALASLRRDRHDWRAVFVGDGDALPSVRALAQDLGLYDDVLFTGFIYDSEEIARIICTADVCLAPEPANPLNDASTMMKIPEYMAMGRPIVCYDLTESRFSARDAALYAKRNDVTDFARQINELLDKPEMRTRMGEIARLRVVEELAWHYSERELLAAYARVLSRRAPTARRRSFR